MVKYLSYMVVLFILLVIAGLSYLSKYNMDNVSINLAQEYIYQLPKMTVMLAFTGIGMLFVFYVYTMKDLIGYFKNKKAVKLKKKLDDAAKHFERGQNYFISKRFDDAIEEFKSAILGNPTNIAAFIKLADAYMQNGDTENAATYYSQALILDNDNVEGTFKMALLKNAVGKPKEALNYIEKILQKDPLNPASIAQKKELLEGLSNWDELIILEKEIIKSLPDGKQKQDEYSDLIGYEYEKAKKTFIEEDYDVAKKLLKSILKENDKFVPAYMTSAEIMLLEGNKNEAVEYLDKANEVTGSMIPLVRLEDLLINMGRPADLIRIYRDALARNPENDVLRFFIGKLYFRLEMLDDAMEIFSSFDNAAIYFPEIHKLRANIYYKRGEFEQAANELLKIYDIKGMMHIPYTCSYCGHKSQDLMHRCPKCKKWSTFSFDLDKVCRV
ncbi:MAG: tetratricopeptide repeat protein [Candidatus Magnetoovum sp. WYHC-5]|nr:tetratricopeptide repeat protein [Candidatus Magnetoovum sp. WYHC-5]